MNLSLAGSPAGSPPDTLTRVRALLAAGDPHGALALLNVPRPRVGRDPGLENARAVCLLRTGEPQRAVEILRPLVLGDHTVILDESVDPALVVNFATALLLCGNVEGCFSALAYTDGQAVAAAPLAAVLRAWERGLTWRQRLRRLLGSRVPGPTLDFPPGAVP